MLPPSAVLSSGRQTPTTARPGVVLATFGGGIEKFRRAAKMLAEDAFACRWFEKVVLWTDNAARPDRLNPRIQHRMPAWMESDLAFVKGNKRGFGYWLWKPILVSTMLASMDDNQILLYADGGCEISRLGTKRFFDYIRIAEIDDALFFRTPHSETAYTKGEVLEFFGATTEERMSGQIQATMFVLRNCPRVRQLVDQWLHLCRFENMRLLTDEMDMNSQAPEFVDHRHDQSILSLLVKRSGLPVVDREDHFDKRLYNIVDSWILLLPFHARRAADFRKIPLLARMSTETGCRKSLRGSLFFRIQFALQSILSLNFDFEGIMPTNGTGAG